MKIVIVGGVAGGASAAARLRRLDEQAEIVLLERGDYISYANCGLPYYIGGEITQKSALTLETPESFQTRFQVDVRTGHEALEIDSAAQKVHVRKTGTGSTYEEGYDRLILSPGAEPLRPPLPGIDSPGIFTLRNIPDTWRIDEFIREKKPQDVAVIGGGYIGMEMAENLVKAGLEVTVVELADHVIGPLDPDMAADVHHYLRKKGIRLLLNHGVQSFHREEDRLRMELTEGERTVDMVLLSMGVHPESSLARTAGLKLNDRGAVVVDCHMRTSEEHIYAVGDVVQIMEPVSGKPGYTPLAGPANKQGRIAADNICGIASAYHGTQGSSVLKLFDMTVACTGLNERTAAQAGMDYDKVYLLPSSHASYYPGARSMNMKVLFEKGSGRILGAQLVGYDGVDKRCDVLATAIRAGMTASDLADLELCYAPPFSSAKDPVNIAGFAIENLLMERVRQYHWNEVDALPRDGSVTLLDVRSPVSFASGFIEGAVNIPLDRLRDRLKELDPGKPVYVNCYSGHTSYVACRILIQEGYECCHLAGGYRLYASVVCDRAPDNHCTMCGSFCR